MVLGTGRARAQHPSGCARQGKSSGSRPGQTSRRVRPGAQGNSTTSAGGVGGSTAYPIQLWAHLSPHPQTTSGVVRCPGDTCRPQPVTQVMHQFTTTVEQAAQNLRHSKCPPLYYLLTIPGISILAWTSLGRSSGCTWSHSCGCSQRSSTRAGGPTVPTHSPRAPGAWEAAGPA